MNITKVAEKLFYSQPSLTKRIQNIEEQLGTKILLRSHKGVRFTPEGEYLAMQAQVYLKFMNETKEQLEQFKNNHRGSLNLGSCYTYSKFNLPEVLYNFSKDSEVNFKLTITQSEELFKMIHDLDGAFIHGEYDGNVDSVLIDEEKAYLLTKDPFDFKDIINHKMISYKTNDKTQEAIRNWWYYNFSSDPSYGVFAGDVDVAWQLVDKKFGYCICFLSDRFENEYGLQMLPLLNEEGNPLMRRTYFVYAKKTEYSPLFLGFLAYLSTFKVDC